MKLDGVLIIDFFFFLRFDPTVSEDSMNVKIVGLHVETFLLLVFLIVVIE